MSLSRVKRLTSDALLCCAALMLSYVEALVPITAVIPFPGFKLGLANTAVMLAFFRLGVHDGIMVSLVRVVLSGILFGSVASLMYSLAGAVASLAIMYIVRLWLARRLSYYGVGILCAAAHNTAQCIAASAVLGGPAVFGYLPVLLCAAVVTGALTGMISSMCSGIFDRVDLL